jgi:hypothetical protein
LNQPSLNAADPDPFKNNRISNIKERENVINKLPNNSFKNLPITHYLIVTLILYFSFIILMKFSEIFLLVPPFKKADVNAFKSVVKVEIL